MQTAEISSSVARSWLDAMIGEYVWASRVGQDAVLRLDFGPPRLQVREPSPRAATFDGPAREALARRVVLPVGHWHLFVESGLWQVTLPGAQCGRTDAESDDPANCKQITKCLSLLDGQKLTAAQIAANGEWRFRFDLGGTLQIAVHQADIAHSSEAVWTLFSDDDTSISYMSNETFCLERADSEPV